MKLVLGVLLLFVTMLSNENCISSRFFNVQTCQEINNGRFSSLLPCRFLTNTYLREEAPNSHVVEQRVEWQVQILPTTLCVSIYIHICVIYLNIHTHTFIDSALVFWYFGTDLVFVVKAVCI